jgi:hypothetical protein
VSGVEIGERAHREIGEIREKVHREIGEIREKVHREIKEIREETGAGCSFLSTSLIFLISLFSISDLRDLPVNRAPLTPRIILS